MSEDNPEMSSYSTMSVEWKEILTKAALTGVIAGSAAALLVPGGSVTVAGMSVPGPVAIGLGASFGSWTGDLAHKFVLPYIPQSQKYQGIESAAISVGGAVAGSYLALSMMGEVPIQTAIFLGGGAFVAGDYAYYRVFSKQGGFVY
jgi:hypothetical protein